jgi:hypothetical protein
MILTRFGKSFRTLKSLGKLSKSARVKLIQRPCSSINAGKPGSSEGVE